MVLSMLGNVMPSHIVVSNGMLCQITWKSISSLLGKGDTRAAAGIA